jgi:ElaB/YqjD/DUF883 family membrane-anchored ribosome-binding protein
MGGTTMAKPNNTLGRSTAREVRRLKDDVAQLVQQLGNVADSAADGAFDQIRAQLQRVKTSIDDLFVEAGDKGQEAAETVRNVGESVAETVEETLLRQPLTTLGLAIGIGFIFGATWRR